MNFYDSIVRLAHVAATVAAMVAAVGASIGFYHMTDNIWLAVLGGAGIASILGLGWWTLITAGSRARRVSARVMTLLIGVLLVGVALGTSGWALASAIGGKSALAAHNAIQVEAHEAALQAAHQRVVEQTPLIDAMATTATAYQGYAQAEASGDLGNGSGCGSKCRTYERAAGSIRAVQSSEQAKVDAANELYATSMILLAEARTMSDPSENLAKVAGSVAMLNAVDLDAGQVGIVNYTAGMSGVSDVSNDNLTQQIVAADVDVAPVETPIYQRVSEAEAVAMYWQRAIGAWIAAFAIDIAPLVMLLIVMVMPMEPLLREQVRERRSVTDAEIRSREEDVEGAPGTLSRIRPAE